MIADGAYKEDLFGNLKFPQIPWKGVSIVLIMEQFQNLVNPSTTLGAFLISVAAGIVASAIIGFFAGRHYQKKIDKKNSIEVNTVMGSITQDKRKNSSGSDSLNKSDILIRKENSIKAGNVFGDMNQDVGE